jgi:UDP-galactopyranose mutase
MSEIVSPKESGLKSLPISLRPLAIIFGAVLDSMLSLTLEGTSFAKEQSMNIEKQAWDDVRDNVYDNVWRNVWDGICEKAWTSVSDNVWNNVHSKVKIITRFNVHNVVKFNTKNNEI